MEVMIEFRNVTKVYSRGEKPAVKNLSLKILEGEIAVFVGPSGCGKTSTMKMVNRLIEPTEGEILINGQNISQMNPLQLRQNIGYVIQNTGLFPHMTVEQNIATVPKLKRWPKHKIRQRVTELLELVGLDPDVFRDRLPGQLSGGQQQRVGVARALAVDPPIMIMDEPFGALDPITREHLQDEFLKIQQSVRKTIVFVTHDIHEAVKMGDKIAVMRAGEVIQYDTPLAILSTPADEFISNLTGEDRAIKHLSLVPVAQIVNTETLPSLEESETPSIGIDSSLKDVLIKMLEKNVTQLSVTNAENQRIGHVSLNQLVDVALRAN